MIVCYYNKRGSRICGVTTVTHPTMAAFLTGDVMNVVETFQLLKENLELVATGKLPTFVGSGNAYLCTITPTEVILKNLYVEDAEVGYFSHQEFLECLLTWERFRMGTS